MTMRLLIVDDEAGIRDMLAMAMARTELQIRTAATAEKALEIIEGPGADVIITDLSMPGMSGMELLREVRLQESGAEVIMLTAYGSRKIAVEAMQRGAFDYITKPPDIDELRLIVDRALEKRHLLLEATNLRAELGRRSEGRFGRLTGDSAAMDQVFELLRRVKDTPATVLLAGESGTGKGVAARALHDEGGRNTKEFISLNCGAIPETLIEAELFGAVRGAYTGLDSDRQGLVRAAQGGTLFLDEIGEMPATAQVRLLQVLQDRVVRPVGSTKEISVDVRIIAATNRVLEDEVAKGNFREDLFYRLNVFRVQMPPLRKRSSDIPTLARAFLEEYGSRYGREHITIDPDAMSRLKSHEWPGNVRELSNVLERAVLLSSDTTIHTKDLGEPFISVEPAEDLGDFVLGPDGIPLDDRLAAIESTYIRQALERTGGNRTEAAKLLHISTRSVRYRISKLGLGYDNDEDQ